MVVATTPFSGLRDPTMLGNQSSSASICITAAAIVWWLLFAYSVATSIGGWFRGAIDCLNHHSHHFVMSSSVVKSIKNFFSNNNHDLIPVHVTTTIVNDVFTLDGEQYFDARYCRVLWRLFDGSFEADLILAKQMIVQYFQATEFLHPIIGRIPDESLVFERDVFYPCMGYIGSATIDNDKRDVTIPSASLAKPAKGILRRGGSSCSNKERPLERRVKVVDMQVVEYWTCQDLKNECPQYFAGLMEFNPNRRRAQAEMDAITYRAKKMRNKVLKAMVRCEMKDRQRFIEDTEQIEAALTEIDNGTHFISTGSLEWALLTSKLDAIYIEYKSLPPALEAMFKDCYTRQDLEAFELACGNFLFKNWIQASIIEKESSQEVVLSSSQPPKPNTYTQVRPPSAPRKLKLNESKDTVRAIVPFDLGAYLDVPPAPQGSSQELVVSSPQPPKPNTYAEVELSWKSRLGQFKRGIDPKKNREHRLKATRQRQKEDRSQLIYKRRGALCIPEPMAVDDDEVSTTTDSSTVPATQGDVVVESAEPLASLTPISSDLDDESTIASASTEEMASWFTVEDKVAEPKIPSTVTISVVVEEEEEVEEVEEVEEDAQYVGEALFYSLDSIEEAAPAGEEVADLVVDTNVAVDAELAESGDDSIPSVSTTELAEVILQEDVAAEVEEVAYPLIGTTIQVQVIAQLGEDDEQSEPLEEDAQVFFPPGEDDTALDHEVSEEDAHYVGAALFCREAAKKKQPRREKALNNLDGAYWTAMPKRRLAKRVEGGVISSPTLRRSARIAALKGQ